MSGVYITDYIDDPCIERTILGDALGSESMRKDIRVLLVWHKHVTREYIDSFPNLSGIVRYGVGFDNVDCAYARSKGIVVCNTPDYGVDEVADTAIAMIMNIARGISRYDSDCRLFSNGTWQENIIKSIKRTSSSRLGVIGAGRIGGSIILKANHLRMQTAFFDPYKPRGYEKMLNSERLESLDDLLKNSDIVSVNVPLSEETRGMICASFVGKMKLGASLVNTARGGLIADIDVFFDALKSGKLSGVALDVLPEEPPSGMSKLIKAWKSRDAWLDGRLIINPHVAYYSEQSFYEMRHKAALNAKRMLDGLPAYNIVN